MAHDVGTEHLTEPHIEPVTHDIGLTSTTLGFSFLAGLGILLMIIALAVGVITGSSTTETATSSSSTITLLFIAGLLALIAGAAAWIGVTQPFRNFDNINVPADDDAHGHAHDTMTEDPDEHAQTYGHEPAIVVADDSALNVPDAQPARPTTAHGH